MILSQVLFTFGKEQQTGILVLIGVGLLVLILGTQKRKK